MERYFSRQRPILGRPYVLRPLNGVDELRELAVLKVADDLQAAPREPT